MPMRFGLQLWSQTTTWPDFRDAALAAERAGWDSVWTWDHLLAIFGPWEQPIFEGWTTMAALGPLTSRVRLGLMVGANTFRNPGLTAKLATTLDHVSDGRAVLGIGAAWFEREHEAFGIDFGRSPGERLDWLDEAVMLMRRLLDGERFDHDGPRYTLRDALCEPRPIQAHLPILIGGSGRQKTLRTVAQRADAWNASATPDDQRTPGRRASAGRASSAVSRRPGLALARAQRRPAGASSRSTSSIRSHRLSERNPATNVHRAGRTCASVSTSRPIAAGLWATSRSTGMPSSSRLQ